MPITLMYITNNPIIAQIADRTGVDRVWIDLEKLGKDERQKGINTVKSKHSLEDIKVIKPLLHNSLLQVRIDPINQNSKNDIDLAIEYGADIIMLPYFKTVEEVKTFLEYVDGRVKTNLLFETAESIELIDEILCLKGIDEVHIGLNDLHLSYGMKFMFELLADGTVDKICSKFKEYRIPYGFGGIAKLGEGMLPAEYVVAEHYRLGSTAAILSRSFYDTVDENDYNEIEKFFKDSIDELRLYENDLVNKNDEFFNNNHSKVIEIVDSIIAK